MFRRPSTCIFDLHQKISPRHCEDLKRFFGRGQLLTLLYANAMRIVKCVRIAYSVCAWKSIILYRNIAAAHARISAVNHSGKSSWEFFFLDNSFARVHAGHLSRVCGCFDVCRRRRVSPVGARPRTLLPSHHCLTVCLVSWLELCRFSNLLFEYFGGYSSARYQ